MVVRRLDSTSIDVLSSGALYHGTLDGHQHIALPDQRSLIDKLHDDLVWTPTPSGKSMRTTLPIAAVPGHEGKYPASSIEVFEQGGKRHEIKLSKQRHAGLPVWKEPVTASPPDADSAYVLLLRDDLDEVHARYLPSLDSVPGQLRSRILAGEPTQELEFEGGLVLEDPLLARIIEALRERHNVILYGPPGTGKTYLMLQVQKAFRDGVVNTLFDPADLDKPFKSTSTTGITDKTPVASDFVTFHASTSYENFIIGLRPQLVSGGLHYAAVPGPFLELAEKAKAEHGAVLLLVDEINRGSTAEIFGEMITVLELDKRLTAGEVEAPDATVAVRLPYTPSTGTWTTIEDGRFRMPWEFYLLASMNSVDRTVAPLDSALRRRFRIIEVPPDVDRLRVEATKSSELLDVGARDDFMMLARLAHNVLVAVNVQIALKRGPDFRLGHSYVWPVVSADGGSLAQRRASLIQVFGDTILPQLVELLRNKPDDLAAALGGVENEEQLFRHHRDPASVYEGGGWLETLPFPGNLNEADALAVLEVIAGGAGAQAWSATVDMVTEPEDVDDGDDEED